MTFDPMRKLPAQTFNLVRRKLGARSGHRLFAAPTISAFPQLLPARHLAQVRPEITSELWFTSSFPPRNLTDELLDTGGSGDDKKPPDERILRLGKTLRTLSPLLPNILTTSLPPEILSPNVSLHLFPSTHPHLPAVKGKVPYRAALWTAPVAWGCVPFVGNTKLQILSEKIVRTGFATPAAEDDSSDKGEEKLVVRWRTERKGSNNAGSTSGAATASSSTIHSGNSSSVNGNGLGINRGLSALLGGDKPIFNLNKDDDFTGLFIFSFDSKGRIASHTIEHADENNGFDKTSKVVTLTDWLLGKAKWGKRAREDELLPGLAIRICREEWPGHALQGDKEAGRHLLEPEAEEDRVRSLREG